MAQPDTSTSPPAKPVIRSYPTPDLRDRVYVESRDARLPDYELPEQGSPYAGRDATRYEGWVFATAQPSDKVGWTDHFYLNERLNQDAYNFTIEYPWVNRDYPRITRTYFFLGTDHRSQRPKPHQKDSVYCNSVMVDWKQTNPEDPIFDSIFVIITKVFERVPAPTKLQLDRPEHVLPFNQRVAVPLIVSTTVNEDAIDGSTPAIIAEEDWTLDDTADSAFRHTRVRGKRVLPPQGSVLNKAETYTRQQQLGVVTSSWQIGSQVITPRALLIDASVTDVGNNTTVKEETVVPRVFPAGEFRVQIPDNVPSEFRDLLPTRSTALTGEGKAAPRNLGPGELERVSEQTTEFIARETVVGRDIDQLPKTLIDQKIDGIPTHGSEFGGVFDIERTLDRAPQAVEEGFGIIASSVKNLGSGLTTRETERLSTLQGAHLLLTAPGRNFVCDPAVVFSSGTVGSGAAGTTSISAIPGGSGDGDPGGTFPLTFDHNGDTNGLFYLLGSRYNGGVWHNPSAAGIVQIGAVSNRPFTQESLDMLVDRQPSNTPIFMLPGGGHLFGIDIGLGRSIVLNLITIRTPSILQGQTRTVRVEATNDLVNFTNISGDVVLPISPINTWVDIPVSNPTAWRYFRIFRTDTNVTDQPLSLGEIEFYGTATITPGVNLGYVFDGDSRGVFFYLGQRGGNGTWRNPHTAGDIVASADGLAFGTLDELVDRQPSNISTDGVVGRAYYFDLKAGRSLVCNKLSFRQRTGFGSGTTSFDLQGRNDLGDPGAWVDLAAVQVPQTPDTWRSVDIAGTIGYRQFRIISAQANFTIGELELYGALSLGTGTPNNGVTGVVITSGGTNYITVPEVRFVGGGGSGAVGLATIANGAVTGVTITNPGSNYTSAPMLAFFVAGGGSGAAATAGLLAGAVTGFVVTSGGSEYGVAPLIQIVGDGTGATAHAVVALNGAVTAVVLDTPGVGYTTASVLFTSAGGPTAIAKVGYGVASIAVTASTANFISPPAVGIIGDGINVTAQAILGFAIDTIVINTRGSGYTSTPSTSITGTGSGATGTAIRGFSVASVSYSPNATIFLTPPPVVVTGGGIFGDGAVFAAIIGRPLLAILVGTQGSGYTSDPSVTVGGDGTGGTAHSVRSFAVATIAATTPGSGYTSAPTVAIDPPTGVNGIQATAHAVLTVDAVTSIVVDNPGFGYLTTPGVTLSGGAGTGATGTAALASAGAIDSIVVDTVGANYTFPPPITLGAAGGSGAVVTSTINTAVNGLLLRIDVVNGGTGYTSPPSLSVAGGSSPVAVLGTAGQIVAVTVTGAGSGFTIPATVTFGGGGGTGATGTGLLKTTGKVKSVTITNNGEGFTAVPAVTFIGGGGTSAAATATLQSTGKIKTLTLIDPGPDYAVAPLVSFFGCSGIEATALYILGTGWPVLTDIITDPVEGIVIDVVKKIVPAGTARPTTGYVDIFALDKYRSIQITSSIDLNSIPPPDIFAQTVNLSLPSLLLSVGAAYSRDTSKAIRINEGFGSASVKSTVRGKIVVRSQDGYRGAVKASVIRTFMFGAPSLAQTPSPLVITPSSGTAYITTRHQASSCSDGTTGGFSYVELSQDFSEAQETLDIGGVLTGGLGVNSNSGNLVVNADDISSQAVALAHGQGINDTVHLAIAVAQAQVSARADLFLTLPVSCPRFLNAGTTFLHSAGVEKWRFGLYVQTLIYITIPIPCPEGTGGYT